MAKDTGTFHKVKVSRNDKYITYHIYKDNKLFLIPSRGQKITRSQAIGIVNILNFSPGGSLHE